MAFIFTQQPTAVLKAKQADNTEYLTIKGVNASLTSATQTAEDLNQFLEIYGVAIAGDQYASLTITKQGVNQE